MISADSFNVVRSACLQVLRRMHAQYVDLASNPFFAFGMPIKSQKFDAAVEAAVTSYGR
jgi:hypothetical protein